MGRSDRIAPEKRRWLRQCQEHVLGSYSNRHADFAFLWLRVSADERHAVLWPEVAARRATTYNVYLQFPREYVPDSSSDGQPC
jgi:hypothetical protein